MCDHDRPVISSTYLRTARKEHQCGECQRDIQPGERYEDMRGLWAESGWAQHRTCTCCLFVRARLLSAPDDRYTFGAVHDEYAQVFA